MEKRMTIGEKYGPLMDMTTEQEVVDYFEQCVEHTWMNYRDIDGYGHAVQMEMANISLYVGYYERETRNRVMTLLTQGLAKRSRSIGHG